MAKDKKNKTTEGCAVKTDVNSNSSGANKKPQKKETKGPKENKVNEVRPQGKDKNINAVPASEPVKKKKHKQPKEETTVAPKAGQNNAPAASKENAKKKSNNSRENLPNGSAGEEPVTKKKKHKQQKEESATPKTGQNNNALKETEKNKKHSSGGNVTNGSAGDDAKKRKRKISEGTAKSGDDKNKTTKAKGAQSDNSPAAKENLGIQETKKRKLLMAEGTSEATVIDKKKRPKKKKSLKSDDKPKEVISGEDEVTSEKKAKQYLNVWNTNKTEWSFAKARQNWLVHHMFDTEKISDATFQTLLKYLAGMKGRSRDETKIQAQSIIDAVTKDKNLLHKKIKLSGEPGPVQRTRAEQVTQIL